jgi:hypothetical protein
MPVILATQEAEIRKITVQSQPKQIVHETLSQKYPTRNRTGGVSQAVEHRPSKKETLSLSSNSTAARKKKKRSQ